VQRREPEPWSEWVIPFFHKVHLGEGRVGLNELVTPTAPVKSASPHGAPVDWERPTDNGRAARQALGARRDAPGSNAKRGRAWFANAGSKPTGDTRSGSPAGKAHIDRGAKELIVHEGVIEFATADKHAEAECRPVEPIVAVPDRSAAHGGEFGSLGRHPVP
jgi:hypothetical protein